MMIEWKTVGEQGWLDKKPDEVDPVKVGISQIESALRIYQGEGDTRLESVFWRVCDGLGDILKYMIETGEHDGPNHGTAKGYSVEMSGERFAEAMQARRIRISKTGCNDSA